MDLPLENDAHDDLSLELAAVDEELVKFVNKVSVDAYNQKLPDGNIYLVLGKAETSTRFQIDGTMFPFIEAFAQFG